MKNIIEIGRILEKARQEKGLSIFEVSSKTKIHEGIIEKIENGTVENSLSKVYVKSFVRKYASFLGIDPEQLLSDYFHMEEVEKKQKLYIDTEEEETPEVVQELSKHMPAIGAIVVGAIIIILIFSGFINLTKNLLNKKRSQEKIVSVKQKEKKEDKIPVEKEVQKKPKKTLAAAAKEIFSKPSSQEISLSMKADQLVWIRVIQDGDIVFQGNLKEGISEKWIAEKEIDVRVGNLNALELTINGLYLGKVGFGVKDLLIDSKGLKIAGQRYEPESQ